ncbi:MAG TPA: hypothetical protein VFD43_05985 [Planctomycetota bacterium]|nr:hypothetical protein [Planctomycetota bacterium]
MKGALAGTGRDHVVRSFVVPCPACRGWTEVRVGTPAVDPPKRAACGACRADIPLDFHAHFGPMALLDGCPACGYHTLYAQKDFNAKLGLLLVLAVFAALLLLGLPLPWLLAALVAFAALDWILLRFVVRRVLICYRCKSQYRGYPPGPSCRPFDLATWEAHGA